MATLAAPTVQAVALSARPHLVDWKPKMRCEPRSGEAARLEAIEPTIRSLAKRLSIGGLAHSDDLLQEGLMAALETIRGWTGRSSCDGLMVQRAHWRMQDALRRVARRPLEVPITWLEDPGQKAVARHEALIVEGHESAVCDWMSLERALAVISPLQREIVRRRFISDESAQRVAFVLGVPRATLSGALRRALRKMRDAIEDEAVA